MGCIWALTSSLAAPPAAAQSTAPAPAASAPTRAPTPLSDLGVAYPEGATLDAVVVLTLTVERDGSVSAVTPNQTNEPFSSRAVSAALNWRFLPATRNGVAVRVRIRVEVAFHPPAPVEAEPAPSAGAASPGDTPLPPRPKPKSTGPVEIEVRGVKVEPSRTASLSRAEVRQIPGTFGDPFRAIEIMPGVTPIISGLPFFFVRGAPPGDVGYFLDGIRVPLLFHIGVGPSVVHPALMDRVDLYPGGYPARFGRFSGGIVSGETVLPATDLHGEYNLRFFDAGASWKHPSPSIAAKFCLLGAIRSPPRCSRFCPPT